MDSVALEEFKQIHEYARLLLSVYVAWFTFFLVLLLGAMGWAAKVSFDHSGRFSRPLPFVAMLLLFTLQLLLSILATDFLRDDFLRMAARSDDLLKLLSATDPLPGYLPTSVLPASIHFSMRLMHYTLISNLVFWIGVGVLLFAKRRRQLVANASGS
jgi:uncharacterized membrane protein YcgQ (UPF0703/DUF1980 family)